jgi:hypothetical protein
MLYHLLILMHLRIIQQILLLLLMSLYLILMQIMR